MTPHNVQMCRTARQTRRDFHDHTGPLPACCLPAGCSHACSTPNTLTRRHTHPQRCFRNASVVRSAWRGHGGCCFGGVGRCIHRAAFDSALPPSSPAGELAAHDECRCTGNGSCCCESVVAARIPYSSCGRWCSAPRTFCHSLSMDATMWHSACRGYRKPAFIRARNTPLSAE